MMAADLREFTHRRSSAKISGKYFQDFEIMHQ